MIKRRLVISSVISIFLVSILLMGSTYSIFTSQEIDETANVYKTGNLDITYSVLNIDKKNSVQITNYTPMTVEEADGIMPYRITVNNRGNVPYEFDVILSDTTSSEENTINYQYIMTKVGYLAPKALNNCSNNIIKENVIVPAGKSVVIDVRIWVDSTILNTEIGKSFYAKLKIDGLAVYNDDEDIDNSNLSLRYVDEPSTSNFKNDTYKNHVKTIKFVDYVDNSNALLNEETNEKIIWDMSPVKDSSVIAWIEDNGTSDENGASFYDIYIGSKQEIYSTSLREWFSGFSNVEMIEFDNFNSSLVNNMLDAFKGCSKLVNLDLSNFNTRNVVDMGQMFYGCNSLVELDVGSFDTRNLTTMYSIFNNCYSLETLDLSNWDISNVTSLAWVFAGCNSLVNLNIGGWDTREVISFESMFFSCSSLVSLDLSSFDTGNVTNMSRMFYRCSGLLELNLNGWNTGNVTIMVEMFYGCRSLTSLDLSSFDTSNVTNMQGMFSGCNYLKCLDLSNFTIKEGANLVRMFNLCWSLDYIDFRNAILSNASDFRFMFDYVADNAEIIVKSSEAEWFNTNFSRFTNLIYI